MSFKNLLIITSFIFISSYSNGNEVEQFPYGSQKHFDQVLLCNMYFVFTGNKKGMRLIMSLVADLLAKNDQLKLTSVKELKIRANINIKNIQELFSQTEPKASKREAAYFLLSLNNCTVHATLGGMKHLGAM